MFKWPGTLSAYASWHELSDFAELISWRDNSMSMIALLNEIGRLGENDYSGGVPEEDEQSVVVEEAYMEIERRYVACRDGYPFSIENQGYTLRVASDSGNDRYIIYKYLLLATRLYMNDNRVHAGIDGTLLFEELAAEVAREYFGNRAESLVFGTSAGANNFKDKVETLCNQLNEGGGYANHNSDQPNQNDGKLDVVVWKRFADRLPSKLIAFGQCKTGTHYKDSLTEIQPDSFCKKWLREPLAFTPVRMFFISEALARSNWYNSAVDAGLLFDRCRIVDFCDNISDEVMDKVRSWTQAAAAATNLAGEERSGQNQE